MHACMYVRSILLLSILIYTFLCVYHLCMHVRKGIHMDLPVENHSKNSCRLTYACMYVSTYKYTCERERVCCVQADIRTLRSDNVKMYEKIKFLESYKPSSGMAHTHSVDVEASIDSMPNVDRYVCMCVCVCVHIYTYEFYVRCRQVYVNTCMHAYIHTCIRSR